MIAEETLSKVVAQVDAIGVDQISAAALRQAWPGVHFTFCSEDDVPARLTPVAEGTEFGVYLVSGAEHCVAFTDHLEAATGLVLATRTEE